MGFFGFGKKSKLGIDIGTASIKIVELTKDANRHKLLNYGIFELESADDAINLAGQSGRSKIAQLSNADVASSIKEILKKAHITSKDVVASIPSFPTFSTTITMPYLSEEDIAKAIPFEARKYIPVPLNEVQLDWAIVQTPKKVAKDAPAGNVEVFLVAVPKVEVARYQGIMKDAGLNLRALELENFALIRALVGNDLSPIAIVNIGGRSTSIIIVENGFQRLSHDYEIGGFEITKSIARALGLNLKRAEELKRNFGIRNSSENIVRQSMSSLIDLMVFETNKTIHNFEDQKHTKVTRIFLVGGLVNMLDFVPYFSEKLGRPVTPGNSFARVVMPPNLENLRPELNATFVVSAGLAMRDL